MAEPKKRKPRIRKSAPTVRERVEAGSEPQSVPLRKTGSGFLKLLKKLSLPDNALTGPIKKSFGFLGRILYRLVPKYFVNAWAELKQVVWPSRKETWRLLSAVFVFAIVFGGLVAGVDKLLKIIFKNVVLK